MANLAAPAPTVADKQRTTFRHDAGIVIGAFAVTMLIVVLWGHSVAHRAARSVVLGAIPFFGRWQLLLSVRLVVAAGVAAALVVILPRLASSASWRGLLGAVAVGTVVFAAALAYADGPTERWTSIHTDYGKHIGLVDESGGPGAFLRQYVEGQPTFPTHLSAHPPGMTLLLWSADRAGLTGVGFESALSLAGAALAAATALVAFANVAGVALARRAAPFVVIAPAAVWHTNADTFYAGVAVGAVTLVVVATSLDGRRGWSVAALGGVAFGCSLLLTYGTAALAVPMIAIAVARRAWGAIGIAGAATVATLLTPLVWGFWWLDGLAATKQQYDLNLADVRPYWYFLVANLAVFATAIGPAVLVGLVRLRDRHAWLLVGATLGAVAIADLSGLSAAETERIWQPFMPLVLAAGAAVCAVGIGRAPVRAWLGLQAAGALTLQAVLRSPW